MSEYTDYDAAAESYEKLRSPVAVDEIVSGLKDLPISISNLHVLDAGCGTGNYSMALLEAGVGKMSLFDASAGMLDIARKKLVQYERQDRIGHALQALLPTIPFDDGLFDVVMINMVLHHIKAEGETERHALLSSVFKEAARVLKKDGFLIITTCLPQQIYGYWYTNLVPKVTKRASRRFQSRDIFSGLLSKSGFSTIDFTTIYGSNWTNRYYEAEGPLDAEWRNLDSYWSLFTDEELQTALTRVLELKTTGTLNQFMLDNDKSMSEGNIVLVKAVKQ